MAVAESEAMPACGTTSRQRELQKEYALRFGPLAAYRQQVWKILTAEFFQRHVAENSVVLDLGCGWGEFINNIRARSKYGMDLNPQALDRLHADVVFICTDCSQSWPLEDDSLDVVFSSNFFEHLPSKDDLRCTLAEAFRCLRPGGRIICMGPNIRYTGGAYWDFWDHYLPLTELALSEALEIGSFRGIQCISRFLPYTMVRRRPAPLWALRLYLKLPFAWRVFGRQFLVVAEKPGP